MFQFFYILGPIGPVSIFPRSDSECSRNTFVLGGRKREEPPISVESRFRFFCFSCGARREQPKQIVKYNFVLRLGGTFVERWTSPAVGAFIFTFDYDRVVGVRLPVRRARGGGRGEHRLQA